MLSRATALLNDPFAGFGIDAAQRRLEFRLCDRSAQAQALGAFTGPAAGRLPAARVVIVAAEMIVIGKGRFGVATRRDRGNHD